MNNMWGSMAQYSQIYWPWPIAVYLFLAGLSAGAMIVAVLLRWKGSEGATFKAAAILAPITIIVGLGLLVLDLGKPLSFYWILLLYNFKSVMSIGVALLLVYTPIACVYAMIAFRDYSILAPFKGLIAIFQKLQGVLEAILLVLSIGVGVYTGFLLSDVSKILLWDTPVLPILFLVSGLSSGIAASVLVGIKFFGEKDNSLISGLLKLDAITIVAEILLLCALFVYLFTNGAPSAAVANKALTNGMLACIFWVFVVGGGLVLPLVLKLTSGKQMSTNLVIFNSFMVLLGVVLLRYYIVYAGQI